MIAVTAELRAKPGRQQALEEVLGRLAARVLEAEPGCSQYLVTRSRYDPQLYLTFERYVDEAALSAHSHAEHTAAALPGLMECLEQPPSLALFEEIQA